MSKIPVDFADILIKDIVVTTQSIAGHTSVQIANCPIHEGYTPISAVFDCTDNYNIFMAYLTNYGVNNSRYAMLYNTNSSTFPANGTIRVMYVKNP